MININLILEKPHLLGNYLGYTKLTEIHSKWIIDCWTAAEDYVLQAHRNSYKTTSALIIGTIWYLMFNPETTILIVRKEAEGAASIINSISKLYSMPEMVELYKELGYKDFRLIEDKHETITLMNKKMVTKEGNIDSMGIGGAITGRHYDKIFCDDISTLKDRVSKAEREKTNSFVRELINVKKHTGNMIFTGTPWHREDVFSIIPKSVNYPLGSIDIPELTPDKINEIKSRTTPSLFAVNYLLKHISDENKIFANAKFKEWKYDAGGIIGHIDCAYSGTHYTALTLMQEYQGIMIIKGWVWRDHIVSLYSKITNILIEHNCGTVWMEDNADKGMGRDGLLKTYPNVMGYHEKENKHNKIIAHLKYHWPEIYFDFNCQEDYLNQILDYEEGQEPDDSPDSAASIIRQKHSGVVTSNLIGVYEFEK